MRIQSSSSMNWGTESSSASPLMSHPEDVYPACNKGSLFDWLISGLLCLLINYSFSILKCQQTKTSPSISRCVASQKFSLTLKGFTVDRTSRLCSLQIHTADQLWHLGHQRGRFPGAGWLLQSLPGWGSNRSDSDTGPAQQWGFAARVWGALPPGRPDSACAPAAASASPASLSQ